jgi:hypothetical protein
MGNKGFYIEETLLLSVERLLMGRVNELLGEAEFAIPLMEFSALVGGAEVRPELRILECEKTEKERIVQLDAYTLSITLEAEGRDGERNAYAYGAAIGRAVQEERTLFGAADRAVVAGKKYVKPRVFPSGEPWIVVVTLRITVEGLGL